MPDDQVEKFGFIFSTIDSERNGELSFEELEKAFQQADQDNALDTATYTRDELMEQFNIFDVKKTGTLDFKEFLTLTSDESKIFTEKNLAEFFERSDTN